ncbi:helix-turn-helix transcriptional regulator [Streptomyces sp. NBC_00287]|uniref:helix-turn-helix transcriptional regulator n=1 Tax=Streptomyces sp. NBC_00287 TaxID=2975702 RepID=UPI002E28F9CB|nr:helix-turn-helix transcriptional regulator [Streptomyces sp. NBC_00287]
MTSRVVSGAERAVDAFELFSRASAGLRRLVPFDAAVWTAADPETGLITAPMLVENLGSGEGCADYWESELLEENVVPFRELARASVPAAGLRAATGDLPARSSRFRRLMLGQGMHDELRAVLRIGERPWGLVSLFRTTDSFGTDDVMLLAGLSRPLAEQLRRCARPPESEPRTGQPAPGLILFDESGEAMSINDEARQHLALLPKGPSFPSPLGLRLPIWVIGTALQARAVADGRDHGDARMRIRTTEGRWLTCHASCLTRPGGLPGPVALVIEPATPADLAVLVADAYGLTSRELQITQLVARGKTTAEIATTLVISPHTVRDHLKTVFAKAGVSSRGELVARLFTEHYWPALPEPTPIQRPGQPPAQARVSSRR